MHFIEIFIVGITLRAIYVRHKTSHTLKSRVNGGTRPLEFVLGDDNDVRPPELYLFAQGIMYYIALNTGSV